eukprot:8882742-Pyramimonas_sp.AAC.1
MGSASDDAVLVVYALVLQKAVIVLQKVAVRERCFEQDGSWMRTTYLSGIHPLEHVRSFAREPCWCCSVLTKLAHEGAMYF